MHDDEYRAGVRYMEACVVRLMLWLCAIGFGGLLTIILLEWMS